MDIPSIQDRVAVEGVKTAIRSRFPEASHLVFFTDRGDFKRGPHKFVAAELAKGASVEDIASRLYFRAIGIDLPPKSRVAELNAAWRADPRPKVRA